VELTTNVAATQAFDPTSEDGAVREAALSYLKSRVDITAALRGKVMMGPIVFPYGQRPAGPDGEPLWSDALQAFLPSGYRRAATVLAELADHAASLDVLLAIEPITHWETAAPNTLEQLQAFLDLVPNPQLGVVIDSAHEVLDGAGIGSRPRPARPQLAALGGFPGEGSAPLPGTVGDRDVQRPAGVPAAAETEPSQVLDRRGGYPQRCGQCHGGGGGLAAGLP
jgi:hypothetical protein